MSVGLQCVAKCNDNKYYRAEVTKTLSATEVSDVMCLSCIVNHIVTYYVCISDKIIITYTNKNHCTTMYHMVNNFGGKKLVILKYW